MKALKAIVKVLAAIVILAALVVGGYLAYLQLSYYRISDGQQLDIQNNQETPLKAGQEYAAVAYNIGFGAYTPDYTFFMDEGIMADGTQTVGAHSTAVSRESVEACTQGSIDTVKGLDADFILLQEVDTDSTRSFNVNQQRAFEQAFPQLGSVFAVNFHSGFLAYPWPEMHGIVNAGLLTMNGAHVDAVERRSYPVDDSFITKFFDLDRCFVVERIPVDNGKQLVLINNHMSAYDEGGLIRAQQLEMLNSVLREEAEAGNYVIVGGDWNHALCGSVDLYPSGQLVPPWVSVLEDGDLAEGFHAVEADNLADVPSCRGDDIPYEKGLTYTVTVDGFIVSDNVTARAQNIDTGFAYSDHNPVKLVFSLQP